MHEMITTIDYVNIPSSHITTALKEKKKAAKITHLGECKDWGNGKKNFFPCDKKS